MIVTFGEWLLARGSGLARVPAAAEREVSVSRHNSLPEAHHLVTVLLRERDEARAERDKERRLREVARRINGTFQRQIEEADLSIEEEQAERRRVLAERDEARAEAERLREKFGVALRGLKAVIRERDEARAEVERLREAIKSIEDLTLYPGAQDEASDSPGTMVFAVCQHALHGDDLPAGSRVGGAAAGDADANPSGLRTDAPGGQDLNYLHGERDGQKWADAFLTVVPGADHDLMHTWFANAIETGYGLGREDGVARAVEARTREIVETLNAAARDQLNKGGRNAACVLVDAVDLIESRFLGGGDDA